MNQKEKAESWDKICQHLRLSEFVHVIDTIKMLGEKAEKYDSFMRDQREWFDAINEVIHLRSVKAQLETLMDSFMVREKCKKCDGKGYYKTPDFSVKPPDEYTIDCPFCHGTGTITRPATVEEVGEFLEYAFAKGDGYSYLRRNDEWIFELKSGHTLFMKEEDEQT